MSRKSTANYSKIVCQVVFPAILFLIAGQFLQISAQNGGCPNVCGLCFPNLTCSSCHDYTTLHNGTCEPCGTNCVNCAYQGICRSCEGGFGPISGTTSCDPCSQSPGCSGVCDKNGAGKCDACRPGYRLDNADCKSCVSNCRSCLTNLTYCDSCNPGFYTFPGNKTCGQCSAHCTKKKSCNLYGAETCDECDPGFYWTSTKSCGPCAANCSSCSVGFQCDICRMGFGLTSSNTCAPCSQNCVAGCNITGASKCDVCDFGYGLTASGSCAPCSPNCSTFGCAVNRAGKCDHCDINFGFTPTNTCAPCSQNCKAGCHITGASKCDACDPGFGLVAATGSCGPCFSNCVTSGCPVYGAGKCDHCDLHFGLTPTNTCAPCSQNCMAGCNITGASKCDACDPGFGLIAAKGACGPCSSNCTTYGCSINGAGKCDHCDQGFDLTPTNTCTPFTTTTVRIPTTASNSGGDKTGASGSPGGVTPGGGGTGGTNGTSGTGGPGGTNGTGSTGGSGCTTPVCDCGSTTKSSGSESNFDSSGELDWRILLTILMFIKMNVSFPRMFSVLYKY